MQKVIEKDVCFDIGGDRQKITSMNSNIPDVTFKQILFPSGWRPVSFTGKVTALLCMGRLNAFRCEANTYFGKLPVLLDLGLSLQMFLTILAA